ncbi:MAG: superoxide dismutase, Ni [Anaerolineaceae bacterium]|nr:superoxide dismutase, Ni [Anaerolineaceae bacterium]
MIHQTVKSIAKYIPIQEAHAHCDIPCGIYDPHQAQVAALTIIRMIDLMTKLYDDHKERDLEFKNSLSRYIAVKEEHAELCKHEIRVIWGDYIKPAHLEKYPQLHELSHKIMQLGSKCRQSANRESALELLKAVNEFAGIFWASKGIETKTVKAPYAPAEDVVYPAL